MEFVVFPELFRIIPQMFGEFAEWLQNFVAV